MKSTNNLQEFLDNPSVYSVLNLENKVLKNQNIGDLIEGIKICSNLQILFLSNIKIRDTKEEIIGNILANCSNLRVLSLKNNKIGDEGISVIGDALANCSNLQALFFNNNNLGDIGVCSIIKSLNNVNCYLDFSYNQITDIGAVIISDMIKEYKDSREKDFKISINLSGNPIGATGILALQTLSDSITELNISGLPEINANAEVVNIDAELELFLMNMVLDNDLERIKQELSPDINERLEDGKSLKLKKYAHDLGREEIIELLNNDGLQVIDEVTCKLNQILHLVNLDLLKLLDLKTSLVSYMLTNQEVYKLLMCLHKCILPEVVKEKLDKLWDYLCESMERYKSLTEDERKLIKIEENLTEKQFYHKLRESLKVTQEDLKTEIEASIDEKIALMDQKEDIISYPIAPDNMFLHQELFENLNKDGKDMDKNRDLLSTLNNLTDQSDKKIESSKESIMLLIGNAGSGKSTMMYILSQQEMLACKNIVTGNFALEPIEHLPNIKIGNGDIVETLIPNKHEIILRRQLFADEEITLFDYPGFSDDGDIQEIANNFYMLKLFNRAKNIKFALVVDAEDIYYANGDNFIRVIEKTLNSFTEEARSQFTNNFSIIVNKLQHDQYTINVERTILQILEQNDRVNEEISFFVNKVISTRSLHSVHLAIDDYYLPNKNMIIKALTRTSYLPECTASMVSGNLTEKAQDLGDDLFFAGSHDVRIMLYILAMEINHFNKGMKPLGKENIKNSGYFFELKIQIEALNQLLEAESTRLENIKNFVDNFIFSMSSIESLIDIIKNEILFFAESFEIRHRGNAFKILSNTIIQESKNMLKLGQILNYGEDKYVEVKKLLSDFISYSKFALDNNIKNNLASLELLENQEDLSYYEDLLKFLDIYKDSPRCEELKIKSIMILAHIYEAKGDVSRAVDYYKLAIESKAYNPEIYNNMGNLYFNIKLYQQAIECYKVTMNSAELTKCYEILISREENIEEKIKLIVEFGDCLYRLGSFEIAKQKYENAKSMCSDLELQAFIDKKIVYLEDYQYEIAEGLAYKDKIDRSKINYLYDYPEDPEEFAEHLAGEYREYRLDLEVQPS